MYAYSKQDPIVTFTQTVTIGLILLYNAFGHNNNCYPYVINAHVYTTDMSPSIVLLNPALAVGQLFWCTSQHPTYTIIVYWLGSLAGAISAAILCPKFVENLNNCRTTTCYGEDCSSGKCGSLSDQEMYSVSSEPMTGAYGCPKPEVTERGEGDGGWLSECRESAREHIYCCVCATCFLGCAGVRHWWDVVV